MGAKPFRTLMIEGAVIEAIRTVFDPEIPVNVYELGLIYGVDVADDGAVTISMTLTSPACPAAQLMPAEIAERARRVSGVTDVRVDVVWDPPWTPERMSEAARLELGFF